MTTAIKGYPFEAVIAGDPPGAVWANQLKCLGWRARWAKYKRRISADELAEVRAKVHALLLAK